MELVCMYNKFIMITLIIIIIIMAMIKRKTKLLTICF